MSVEAIAIALHHSRARGTARIVLFGIANHDGDGGAWPAMATLARYAGVSLRRPMSDTDDREALADIVGRAMSEDIPDWRTNIGIVGLSVVEVVK